MSLITKLTKFEQIKLSQNTINEEVAEDFQVQGGISSETRFSWLTKGSYLEVRDNLRGSCVGSWTFGGVLQDTSCKIVCVEEIWNENGRLQLAVAVNNGLDGILCIFNVTGSKVIRAIQIGEKISSLHVVDAGYDDSNLSGPLRNFDGIVAIGTEHGEVLLLDLCKQLCKEAIHKISSIRDELNPCQLIIIKPSDTSNIEHYKEASLKEGAHLAIHLNAIPNKKTEHFVLKEPNGSDKIHVNKEEVLTSALYYTSQFTSLLIGYNFGAFQVWNLSNFILTYTSPICEEHVPITHFCIQEPVDDPRAFCYVWVIYSNLDINQPGFPIAVLYAFSFESKDYQEGFGNLYQDFQHSSVRFQIELDASEYPGIGGVCTRVQSVVREPLILSNDMLTVCLISWKAKLKSKQVQDLCLLFDLNQWYKEQMPSGGSWDSCSNFLIKLNISKEFSLSGKKEAEVLDIILKKKSLQQFNGTQKLEEHFYPSSLTFELSCLRETDIAQIHQRGLQRSVLCQIESAGPLCLIRPAEICQEIIAVGLFPLFVDMSISVPSSITSQREIVLDVALEYHLIGWLCRCASDWANGSFASAGCSLDFLINWAFQRCVVLKKTCDTFCKPLFDYSETRLDSNICNLLNVSTRQLNDAATLLSYILGKLPQFLSNQELVLNQFKSLQMINEYFEVLQWLMNVGLLPECHPDSYPRADEHERISAPYPAQDLVKHYNEKREMLKQLTQNTFVKSDSLLFIDNLITQKCGAEKLQKQWQDDGGSGLYPPPSLQSLLRTYLINGPDIKYKHSLVIYVFLDLAMALDQGRYAPVITNLIKFPAVFKVSPSIIKITQAFWQLDHGDYTTAMEQLLDPFVLKDDLQQWHHAVALRSLLLQNQPQFAMLYLQIRRPPMIDEKDVLTVISLFVANNMLDEAFYFQKSQKNIKGETILSHLFNECRKSGVLQSILCRNLEKDEENSFLTFLRSTHSPSSKELEVFYYLLRSRFVEAFNAQQNSKRTGPESQGLIGQRHASKADQIIRLYKNFLPDVNKNLVNVVRKEGVNLWKEVQRPTPLSVFVHNSKEKIQYKSTVIHAALAKAKQTFRDGLDNSNVVCTEETPFLRTPKAPIPRSRTNTPVINPVIIEASFVDEECAPSPSKKMRFSSDLSPNEVNLTAKLNTPIIKRKISTPQKSSNSIICTPHSILKVRNLMKTGDIFNNSSEETTVQNLDEIPRRNETENTFNLSIAARTPIRQNVRFDVARFSSSFSDNNLSSKSNSREVSKNISSTTEEYQSADSSIQSNPTLQKSNLSIAITENPPFKELEEDKESDVESMEMAEVDYEQEKVMKGRRSYRKSNLDSPVRSSPRRSRRLSTEATSSPVPQSPVQKRTTRRNSVETSVSVQATPSPRKRKLEESDIDVKKDESVREEEAEKSSFIEEDLGEQSEDIEESDLSAISSPKPRMSQRISSRKSLSRQVLENNAAKYIKSCKTEKVLSYTKSGLNMVLDIAEAKSERSEVVTEGGDANVQVKESTDSFKKVIRQSDSDFSDIASSPDVSFKGPELSKSIFEAIFNNGKKDETSADNLSTSIEKVKDKEESVCENQGNVSVNSSGDSSFHTMSNSVYSYVFNKPIVLSPERFPKNEIEEKPVTLVEETPNEDKVKIISNKLSPLNYSFLSDDSTKDISNSFDSCPVLSESVAEYVFKKNTPQPRESPRAKQPSLEVEDDCNEGENEAMEVDINVYEDLSSGTEDLQEILVEEKDPKEDSNKTNENSKRDSCLDKGFVTSEIIEIDSSSEESSKESSSDASQEINANESSTQNASEDSDTDQQSINDEGSLMLVLEESGEDKEDTIERSVNEALEEENSLSVYKIEESNVLEKNICEDTSTVQESIFEENTAQEYNELERNVLEEVEDKETIIEDVEIDVLEKNICETSTAVEIASNLQNIPKQDEKENNETDKEEDFVYVFNDEAEMQVGNEEDVEEEKEILVADAETNTTRYAQETEKPKEQKTENKTKLVEIATNTTRFDSTVQESPVKEAKMVDAQTSINQTLEVLKGKSVGKKPTTRRQSASLAVEEDTSETDQTLGLRTTSSNPSDDKTAKEKDEGETRNVHKKLRNVKSKTRKVTDSEQEKPAKMNARKTRSASVDEPKQPLRRTLRTRSADQIENESKKKDAELETISEEIATNTEDAEISASTRRLTRRQAVMLKTVQVESEKKETKMKVGAKKGKSKPEEVFSKEGSPNSGCSTPTRRSRRLSTEHSDTPSNSGIKSRLRRASTESRSFADSPVPAKRGRRKRTDSESTNETSDVETRSVRSRTNSVSSAVSDVSEGRVAKAKRTVAKKVLPEIVEDPSENTTSAAAKKASGRGRKKKA